MIYLEDGIGKKKIATYILPAKGRRKMKEWMKEERKKGRKEERKKGSKEESK